MTTAGTAERYEPGKCFGDNFLLLVQHLCFQN